MQPQVYIQNFKNGIKFHVNTVLLSANRGSQAETQNVDLEEMRIILALGKKLSRLRKENNYTHK